LKPVTTKKTLYRNDTKVYNLTLKRNGAVINTTGYTVYVTGKTKPDGTELFSNTTSPVTHAEGTHQVTLASTDLATLCEDGIAEVMIEDGSGKQDTLGQKQDTLGQFYFEIVRDLKTT